MAQTSTWLVRVLSAVLKVVIVIYAAMIFFFIWFTKDLTFASLGRDPLFASYSIAVVIYVIGRFVTAMFYRSLPDKQHRPTVSIIIPAFNEEEGIIGTIDSCLAVEYPAELFEVIAVNDGSTDHTWARMTEAHARTARLQVIDLGRNYGKRGAMAEGIRRAKGEILCFVDSDSYLKSDGVLAIVQPFIDDRVGAVVGHAEVHNKMANWITKMQQVRYYSAFSRYQGNRIGSLRNRHLRFWLFRSVPEIRGASAAAGVGVPNLPRSSCNLRRRSLDHESHPG